jgi:crotonobetainyl-CoA:carnitine CoA-transferase CaiB-like acyl-CoA transferase
LDLEVPADGRWDTNPGRVRDRARVEATVAAAVEHLSRDEVEARLPGVPCAPVNSVLEALADAQVSATGTVTATEGVQHVASPHRFHV